MRKWTDWLLPGGTALTLVLFFGLGLLWPLADSLGGAFTDPPKKEKIKDKETLADFARRVQVEESTLRTLNKLAPAAEPKPGALLNLSAPRTTLDYFLVLFARGSPQAGWMINSLLLAAATTFFSSMVAYPLAYWQSRTDFKGRALLGGLLLLPLIMPPFVGAIGLRRIFSRYGMLNQILIGVGLEDASNPIDFLGQYRLLGCVFVMTLHFYPLIYLNLAAAISSIDPALHESARNLGLSPWQVFRRVTFPLSLPGLLAGGSLVFTGAFMDLGTPLIFGYQEVVAHQIFALSNEQSANPAAPALVTVATLLVLVLFFASRYAVKRLGGGGGSGVKGASRGGLKVLSGTAFTIVVGFHVMVIALAALPHVSIFLAGLAGPWVDSVWPQSFTLGHVEEALSHKLTQLGVRNSLLYAALSTSIDLVLGLACAWVVVRRGGVWGKIVDALTLIPLAVPGLVLAFGYVGAYSGYYSGDAAKVGVGFFLVLSYAIRRLPYTVRACAAGLEQTSRSLEEAAGSLGCTPLQVLRRVTLPLIAAQIAAGAILAFAFAMLEVSDSLVLATRPNDFPLTKTIYTLFGRPGDGDQLASALGLFALFFLAFALLAASSFMGRKWGEAFKG